MRYRTLLIIPALLCSWIVAVARPGKRTPQPPNQRVERSTAANPDVVVYVCLDSGSLSVQTWDRNQVRVRSSDGVPIELRRPAAASNSEPAKELALSIGERPKAGGSCIPSGDIEIDLPREANLQLQTRDANASVSGVARVHIVTQGGTVNVQ